MPSLSCDIAAMLAGHPATNRVIVADITPGNEGDMLVVDRTGRALLVHGATIDMVMEYAGVASYD